MRDPYDILGVSRSAGDDDIKKAYRSLCKKYHPDLNPGDAVAEERFKEVQAAYDEVMRQRQGGGSGNAAYGYGQRPGYGQNPYGQGYGQQYGRSGQGGFYGWSPFGGFWGFDFGEDPFGRQSAGGYTAGGQEESNEMAAARNYINARHYNEAMNALNMVPPAQRNARWYYYAALASAGLGNRINALEYARTAVEKDPNNMEYRQLYNRLQNQGQGYTYTSQGYGVPHYDMGSTCMRLVLLNLFCNLCCRFRC